MYKLPFNLNLKNHLHQVLSLKYEDRWSLLQFDAASPEALVKQLLKQISKIHLH